MTPKIIDYQKSLEQIYQLNVILDGMNYYNKHNSYLSIDVYDDPIVKDAQIINDGNYKIFIQVSS